MAQTYPTDVTCENLSDNKFIKDLQKKWISLCKECRNDDDVNCFDYFGKKCEDMFNCEACETESCCSEKPYCLFQKNNCI